MRRNDESERRVTRADEAECSTCEQVLIGHGIAHAEVGSNVYLMGESRLSADQEELLALLGWKEPIIDDDVRGDRPANWTLALVLGDWQHLTEMFASTMIGILGFSEHLPVEVMAFGADHPCRDCSWTDQLDAYPNSGGISSDISPMSDNDLGRAEVDI